MEGTRQDGEESNVQVKQHDPSRMSSRALVVSSMYTTAELAKQIGREAYSYRFVFNAFRSLLERWGQTSEVTSPESRLEYALWKARQEKREPIHLSFLPLHLTYLAQGAPNIAVPAWEFPDIPSTSFGNNPRNNWARIAGQLDVLITHCQITRNAFLRAGVRTPVHLVPVPVAPSYFQVPPRQADQRVVIDCPCYVFPQPRSTPAAANPWVAIPRPGLRERGRRLYKNHVKRLIPRRMDMYLTLMARALGAAKKQQQAEVRIPHKETSKLELSGVVYTTIFNPFDPRKNWQDMLSGYLLALSDRADATLVIKLVICPELAAVGLNAMVDHYQRLGIEHRCKLVFVTAYLSAEQMVQLAQASTYYLNASRAEGSCLPLQDYLAAGRPGIAPAHTGMADYHDQDVGFTLASHPEPAAWPHDPEQRLRTVWHRLVWQSLYDQLRAGYQVATTEQHRYQELAMAGRARMQEYASQEAVWPALATALDAAVLSSVSESRERRAAG